MDMMRIKIHQTGSVLLEALVAILIFSIGILALVGMEATAISTVSDAQYRSTAGFLANQIVGTIRATRFANAAVLAQSNVMVSGPDPTFACNHCDAGNGNAITQGWVANELLALPNSTLDITIAGSIVSVELNWTPPNAAAGALPHKHVVATVIN